MHHKIFPHLLICVLVFLLNGNTLNHSYNFDDEYVVLNQQVQQGITAIPEIFSSRYHQSEDQNYGYRPIAKSTFAIEYSIFGLNPKVSHFINLLLYAISLVVLFKLLTQLRINSGKWEGLLICLLFLAHPIHTEVVASLKNREELLSLFFGIVAIKNLFDFLKTKNYFVLLLSGISFVISILSKESGILFFVIGLLQISIFLNRKKITPKLTKLHFPFTQNIRIKTGDEVKFFLLFYSIMVLFLFVKVPGEIESIPHILATIIWIVIIPVKYFKKLKSKTNKQLWALGWIYVSILVVFHYTQSGLYTFLFGLLFVTTFLFFKFLQMNFSAIRNFYSSFFKPLIFRSLTIIGFVCFGILIISIPDLFLSSEELNPTVISNPIETENVGLKRIAFAGKIVSIYAKMLVIPNQFLFYYGYNTIPVTLDIMSATIGIFIVLLLSVLTIFYFTNTVMVIGLSLLFGGFLFFSNLFFDVPGIIGERLMYAPSLGFSILLGILLFKLYKLKFKFAKPIFWLLSISIFTFYSFKTIDRNKNWKDKATLYSADIDHLENSARANLIYGDFLFGEAKEKLEKTGLTKEIKDQIQAAAFYYERSLNVDPSNFTVKNNLGSIYYSYLAKPQKGKQLLIEALKDEYANYYAFNNIGTIYADQGKLDSAIIYFKKGQKIKANNIFGLENLGLSYYEIGQLDSAFKYFEKTLQLDPQKELIHLKMGDLLVSVGQPNDALNFYNYALRINPNNSEAFQKREKLIDNEN